MEVFDEEKLTQKFEEEYENVLKSVQKPGVLLVGQTGVGKSSLVNMIFGEELAKTGTGKPVTDSIKCFESEDTSVRIYDSMGYETKDDGDKRFVDEVIGLVKDSYQKEINIIWYCISTLSSRVTDYDLKTINAFLEANIPLAVLFTKADKTDDETVAEMRKVIQQNNASLPVFETSIHLPDVNQIEKLIDWSIEKLPQHLRFAFISQQKVNFEQKRKSVRLAIGEHVVGAGLVGAVPIPGADAPILVGNELALMARILYIYDMGGIGNALKSSVVGTILSTLGKSLAGNLLKLIPVVGQAVGAVINAGVAVAITWAFGGAVAIACEQVWKAKLEGGDVAGLINNFGKIVGDIAKENMENKRSSEDTVFKNL